jgi:archaellum component FlaC
VTKLDDISLAIGELRADAAETKRQLANAAEQREEIAERLGQLKDLLATQAQAFERFMAQQAQQHVANQAAIAAQNQRLDRMQPIVERSERERERLKGAKRLAQMLWVPLAGAAGYAADKLLDFLRGVH